jgi:hypothetical protein
MPYHRNQTDLEATTHQIKPRLHRLLGRLGGGDGRRRRRQTLARP